MKRLAVTAGMFLLTPAILAGIVVQLVCDAVQAGMDMADDEVPR